MLEGIRLAAAGARAQSLVHDVIANNLANAATTGFRRQIALLGAGPVRGGGAGAACSASAPMPLPAVVSTVSASRPGPLVETGRQTDLALEGEGFFVVGDGRRRLYTRAGNFAVVEAGRLVTADRRFQVLDTEGRPIRVDRALPVTVTEKGEVLQNGAVVGRLAVVAFRDPGELRPVGGGLFAAPPGARPTPARTAVVHQGYLERSSVEAVRELVAMLEAFRAYEANVNLMASQDAALRRLINEAGRGL